MCWKEQEKSAWCRQTATLATSRCNGSSGHAAAGKESGHLVALAGVRQVSTVRNDCGCVLRKFCQCYLIPCHSLGQVPAPLASCGQQTTLGPLPQVLPPMHAIRTLNPRLGKRSLSVLLQGCPSASSGNKLPKEQASWQHHQILRCLTSQRPEVLSSSYASGLAELQNHGRTMWCDEMG